MVDAALLKSDPADRPIAVFDSGLGGLTVAAEIRRRMPEENLVFLADMARVPYASLSPALIERFSAECFQFLLAHDPKVLVIACNTVSSACLEETRQWFPRPIIDVIAPSARAAAQATRNGCIGVLATKATVRRRAYETMLASLRPDVRTTSNGCPLFVPLVEEGWLDGDIPERIVEHYVKPVAAAGVDTVVMGCTHYEYLRVLIQKFLGPHVTLINTPEVTAQALHEHLASRSEKRSENGPGIVQIHSSDITEVLERVVGQLFAGDAGSSRLTVHQAHIVPRSPVTVPNC